MPVDQPGRDKLSLELLFLVILHWVKTTKQSHQVLLNYHGSCTGRYEPLHWHAELRVFPSWALKTGPDGYLPSLLTCYLLILTDSSHGFQAFRSG